MDEGEFIQDIRGWTGITDPTVHTDDMVRAWIRMAESMINIDLRVDKQIKVVDALEVTDNEATVPEDWLQNDVVFDPDGEEMEYLRLVDFRRRGRPTGYYSMSGRTLLVGGAAPGTGPLELHYFAKVPKLVTGEASWLLDDHPMLLTYATLVPAFTHAEEPQKAAMAEAKVGDTIARLNEAYLARSAKSGTLRRPKWGFRK